MFLALRERRAEGKRIVLAHAPERTEVTRGTIRTDTIYAAVLGERIAAILASSPGTRAARRRTGARWAPIRKLLCDVTGEMTGHKPRALRDRGAGR